MEISNGPDGTVYQLHVSDEGNLVVSPWPFEEASFHVTYESRSIQQIAFKNDEAFRQKLQSADVLEHRLTIAKE